VIEQVMTDHHVSPIPREARPYQGRRAGLVTRLLAGVLDGLVVAALLLACYLAINGARFLVNPRRFQVVDTSALPVMGVAVALAFVYLAASWSVTGRTYGGHVLGLRLLDRLGRKPGAVVSLVRAALCVAFPLGLFWCAFSRRRSSVQDLVLRTSVVYDWSARVDVPTAMS
jgi:uncharacterized RDD family membrane protein YckC